MALTKTTNSMILGAQSNVLDFGAIGDGVADNTSAFTTANSGSQGLVIPAGSYAIASNVVFTVPVELYPGASFIIPNGVTLAFNGGFTAPLQKTFYTTGTGLVTFNPTKTSEGFAEWWGAAVGGFDSGAAINAAIVALLKVQLMAGDYFTSTTIKLATPHRELRGVGYAYADTTNQVTRILMTDGATNTVQIGPDTEPATINDFQKQNKLSNVYVARSVAPVIASACTSVLNKYTLYAAIDDVKCDTSIYGFQFYGTVDTTVTNCSSVRAVAGTGAGTDLWYGYYVNGFADIGAAGGNASLYINYSSASCNFAALQASGSSGFYLDNKFTDCFLESPETVSCHVGIQVQGDSSNATIQYGNLDLQIKNPINDQCGLACIYINNVNKSGSIEVHGGYGAPSATATAALLLQNSYGITFRGGQYPMQNLTSVGGISCTNCANITIDKTILLECSETGVGLATVTNSDIRPIIKNNFAVGGSAVQLSGTCTANYVQPTCSGGATGHALGIQVIGTSDARNEYNCSLIDSTAVAGGSMNKLVRNGVQIVATGLSGSNLVSGVMT